jgi:uncharacterized protein YdiU (UPF0061 family)
MRTGHPTTRALAVIGCRAGAPRDDRNGRRGHAIYRAGLHCAGHSSTSPQRHRGFAGAAACSEGTIARYFPIAGSQPQPRRFRLPSEVALRTAAMVAQWQAVGFCHGVMNTDNMSILGLTIDYGPFQFLDAFDPGHICNHSDEQGRYAYARQPGVAFWNLYAGAGRCRPSMARPKAA